MSTKQGLLLSIRAVIAQGKKSVNDEDLCMYRGFDGLKCAIGHLIPDSKYSPYIEDKVLVSGRVVEELFPKKYKTDSNWINLFTTLQTQHDNAVNNEFVSSFKGRVGNAISEGMLPKYCLEAL